MLRLLWVFSLLLATAVEAGGTKPKKRQAPPQSAPKPAPEPVPEAAAGVATPPPPAPPAGPDAKHVFTVGLTALTAVSISTQEAALHADVLAQLLTGHGLRVMSSADIAAVLGLERQQQLLGCTDSTCLSELGAAMGFDALVLGSVGKVDGLYSLVVRVIKPSDARTLTSYSRQGLTAKGLEQALARAAWDLAAALAAVPGSSVTKPAAAPPEVMVEPAPGRVPWRPLALIPGVLGLGGIGAGVYMHLQAGAAWARLNTTGLTLGEADTALKNGLDAQNAERGCFAVGGTLVAAAVVMFALGGSSDTVTPVAWVDGHGAMFGLAGALP